MGKVTMTRTGQAMMTLVMNQINLEPLSDEFLDACLTESIRVSKLHPVSQFQDEEILRAVSFLAVKAVMSFLSASHEPLTLLEKHTYIQSIGSALLEMPIDALKSSMSEEERQGKN